MKEINKRSFLYFISFMLMASTFLPIAFANLPPIIRSHHIWTVMWFFFLIVLYPKILQSKLLLFILLYGAVMMLIFLIPNGIEIIDWDSQRLFGEIYQIIVAVSVITYFRMEKDFLRLAKLVKWTLLFVFITSIMTIYTSVVEPNYVRIEIGLVAESIGTIKYISDIKRYGSGSYGFAGALLCLLPILIYYFKNNLNSIITKKYLIIFIAVIFLTLLRMQIFANILLAVLIIILSIMGRQNTNKANIISIIVVLIILFIPTQFYVNTIFSLGSWFPTNSDMYLKLNDLGKIISIGDLFTGSAMGGRAERYPLLIDSFLASPFLGNYLSGDYKNIAVGAHLHWMYKFAAFGLLTTIPFFYLLYKIIKNSLIYFDKEFTFFFLMSVFSIITLGLMKTLVGREMWYMLFIIVPGLYHLPLLKKTKKSAGQKYDRDINAKQNKT